MSEAVGAVVSRLDDAFLSGSSWCPALLSSTISVSFGLGSSCCLVTLGFAPLSFTGFVHGRIRVCCLDSISVFLYKFSMNFCHN